MSNEAHKPEGRVEKGARGVSPFIAICATVGLVLGVLVFLLRRESGIGVALADAMLVPGVLALSLGGLLWVRELGGFDLFSYALRALLLSFIPGGRSGMPSYGEYKRTRRPTRLPVVGLLSVGLLFLAPAVILSLMLA